MWLANGKVVTHTYILHVCMYVVNASVYRYSSYPHSKARTDIYSSSKADKDKDLLSNACVCQCVSSCVCLLVCLCECVFTSLFLPFTQRFVMHREHYNFKALKAMLKQNIPAHTHTDTYTKKKIIDVVVIAAVNYTRLPPTTPHHSARTVAVSPLVTTHIWK